MEPRTLTPAQCRSLIARPGVARVAFTDQAMPAVAVVPFALRADALRGDAVVFPAPAGSRLARAVHNAVVAVEVGDVDARGAGWSVSVTGTARQVRDATEREGLARLLGLDDRADDVLVVVPVEVVDGQSRGAVLVTVPAATG